MVEQTVQTFQYGYARFAFQCNKFCESELLHSASFNDAAMVSGHELVCRIRLNCVGGIVVVVQVRIFNPLPREITCSNVVPQCETPYLGFIIRHKLTVYQHFRLFIKTAVHPHDAIANLPASFLDSTCHAMKRPRATKAEQVSTWLRHTQGFREYRRHPRLELTHLGQLGHVAVT